MGQTITNIIAIPGVLLTFVILAAIFLAFAAPDRLNKILAALSQNFDHLQLKLGKDREFTTKFREPVKEVRKRNPPSKQVVNGQATITLPSVTLRGAGTVSPPTGSGPGLTTKDQTIQAIGLPSEAAFGTPRVIQVPASAVLGRSLDRELVQAVAKHSRKAAVITTWAQLEREIRYAGERNGIPDDLSWIMAVQHLYGKDLIDEQQLQDLIVLGEAAERVQSPGFIEAVFTYEDAMGYLDAADALVTHLSSRSGEEQRSKTD